MNYSPIKTLLLAIEKTKASTRTKVEHPFHVIMKFFGAGRFATRVAKN